MSNKLSYFGTNEDVKMGDRVEYLTFFLKRRQLGTVVCIPKKTALELAKEKKNSEDWLIKFDDGTYTGWHYNPEELQPPRRLRLIARATGDIEKISNEELDRLDAEEVSRWPGLVGEYLGCATIILLVFVGFVVLLSIF